MAHTVFVDGVTTTANRIVAAWLNDADTVTYVRFGDGTNYTGNLTVPGTSVLTGVATLTAQPILSSLTASLPVFSDGSKGLVSNAMTGTGSVMMSASPTTTGTLTAAAINASGTVAMAGAATVGTTLGVTGTSTMAAINATNITATTASGYGLTVTTAANAFSGINLARTVNTASSWDIYTPAGSTDLRLFANGADRFTITNAGAVTIPGTLAVAGVQTLGSLGVVNAITNSGNSYRINIDSTNIGSGNSFEVAANTAAASGGTSLLVVEETGAVTIPGTLDVSTGTGNIGWGTYTPTLTNTTNVGAATAYLATYMRVGNTVTVAGQIDLDPTALGATELGISLPVASNFTTTLEMGGTAAALGVTEVFGLSADATNDRAKMSGLAVSSANHQVAYHFTYQVK